jgi:hypothetical protein
LEHVKANASSSDNQPISSSMVFPLIHEISVSVGCTMRSPGNFFSEGVVGRTPYDDLAAMSKFAVFSPAFDLKL